MIAPPGPEAGVPYDPRGRPAEEPPDRRGLAVAGLVLGALATVAVLVVVGTVIWVRHDSPDDAGEDVLGVFAAVVVGVGALVLGLVGTAIALAAVLSRPPRPGTRRLAVTGLVLSIVPVVALAALIVQGRWT